MTDLAIVAVTPRGADLARRLQKGLGRGALVDAAASTAETLQKCFRQGRPLVCIMALGIVVRALARVLESKSIDPPVVVVDEAGRFAISVLGGHAGGANVLATEVASTLAATPVITTASDVLQVPAVDLIGKKWGWKIERQENLTRVAAAVVQGKPVAVYQDAGRPDWGQPFGAWPHHFERISAWPESERWDGLLIVSDRVLPEPPARLKEHTLIYRPPSLTLGVGCRRGTSVSEVEDAVAELFERHSLYPGCITALASVAFKKNEPALIEFSDDRQIPFLTYGVDKLALIDPLPSPSEKVRAKIGVAGVSEPAAMLAAGVQELVVPKTRFRRVTLAVARRPMA